MPDILLKDNPEAKVIAAIVGILPTRKMILAGGGAGVLPRFLGESDERLIACSGDLTSAEYRLFIGSLPEQRSLHRLRIVMKHLSIGLTQALRNGVTGT